MKTEKLSKKDFTKHGLKTIINRDIDELNSVSNEDLLSVWCFFKFLVTDIDDNDIVFVTKDDSIVAKCRAILQKKGIKISTLSEVANDGFPN